MNGQMEIGSGSAAAALAAAEAARRAKKDRDQTRVEVSKAQDEGDKAQKDIDSAADAIADNTADTQAEMDKNKEKVAGLTPEEKAQLGNDLLAADTPEVDSESETDNV